MIDTLEGGTSSSSAYIRLNMKSKSLDPNTWIVATGDTHHMTHRKDWLQNLNQILFQEYTYQMEAL